MWPKVILIFNKTTTITIATAGGAENKNQCLDPEDPVRKRKKQTNKQPTMNLR